MLLACAGDPPGPGGPQILSASLSAGPNPDVPLVARLELSTDVATTLSLTDLDRSMSWPLPPHEASMDHDLWVVGFRAGETHRLQVTARDLDGATTDRSDPLVFEADPLPADFPAFDVVVTRPEAMEPGVTLFPLKGIDAESRDYAAIVDSEGRVVWYLTDPLGVTEIKPLSNGHLIYGRDRTDLVEIDLSGTVHQVWQTLGASEPVPGSTTIPIDYLHHDIIELPEDRFATFGIELRNHPSYPTSESDPSAPRTAALVVADVIVDFDRDGTIINQYAMGDRLDPNRIGYDSVVSDWWSLYLGSPVVDWSHGNALFHDATDDSFLASFRHQDAVVKLSRATGDLQWILAPSANWGPAHQPLVLAPAGPDFAHAYHQHGSKVTVDGTIVMFDNGNWRASAYEPRRLPRDVDSRAVEYRVDPVAMTQTQVWEWGALPEPNFAAGMGDVDLLPTTDNALITYGALSEIQPGDPSAQILEVTRDTSPQIVFHLSFDRGPQIYRAERLGGAWPFP